MRHASRGRGEMPAGLQIDPPERVLFLAHEQSHLSPLPLVSSIPVSSSVPLALRYVRDPKHPNLRLMSAPFGTRSGCRIAMGTIDYENNHCVLKSPANPAATTAYREALNQAISSGNFVDTKIILYSSRDSSGRVCRPKGLYANSHVLKTVPYFDNCESCPHVLYHPRIFFFLKCSLEILPSLGRKISGIRLMKRNLWENMGICLTATLKTTRKRRSRPRQSAQASWKFIHSIRSARLQTRTRSLLRITRSESKRERWSKSQTLRS